MVAKTIALPNIKKCFIPNPGYIVADTDLKQADAQVVAWEANDDKLKYIFRNNLDLHLANVESIYNVGIHVDDLGNPEYVEKCKADYQYQRDMAKRGVHLTNYLGQIPTCAKALGITRHEAERFQSRWFSEHPGIRDWHLRIEDSLMTNRTIENIFGYKRQYFGRLELCLSEAVAWIPQSTVALIISKALIKAHKHSYIDLLMQVHDSIVFQFPKLRQTLALTDMHNCMNVTLPYDDPWIIPSDVAISDKSWGDVKEVAWPA